jgi:hypothetical protein
MKKSRHPVFLPFGHVFERYEKTRPVMATKGQKTASIYNHFKNIRKLIG